MSEITVDAEKVIKAVDKIDEAVSALRRVLAPGVFKEVPRSQRAEPPKETAEIMALDINVSQIGFKVKGGAAATDYDGFAFTFLRKSRDGPIWEHNIEIHSALCQYGKVSIGRFTYQLSKDGVFIQRVKSKG